MVRATMAFFIGLLAFSILQIALAYKNILSRLVIHTKQAGNINPHVVNPVRKSFASDSRGQYKYQLHGLVSEREDLVKELSDETVELLVDDVDRKPSLTSLLRSNEFDPNRNAIVLIAGFEKFNSQLYTTAAAMMQKQRPDIPIYVFTDTDIVDQPEKVSQALDSARVLLCSLIFDYSNIKWIKERIKYIPYRFCFESALELMSETVVDNFNMMTSGDKPAGPPPVVKSILQKFGSSREEDKMVGYLKLLKVGPKLLQYVPSGTGLNGIKTWITVYSYWTESGLDNIVSMFKIMINECGFNKLSLSSSMTSPKTMEIQSVKEYPALGIYHPSLNEAGIMMTDPKAYLSWYLSTHTWVKDDTPRVGVLLYRKHVISEQGYIGNMINLMESNGILPIPIYINGVEGHTVVRDLFTSSHEQQTLSSSPSDAVAVDAVVNTIGFPLVGGPAGSMEGGRSIDAAKEILQSKNIPYIVAAPLLIQNLESWQRNGVQGLQTVVLYSLPELDGAIETVVLGGLVGDKIVVLPERVRKLCYRLKAWVNLRKQENKDRRIATLVYGFPPNVGSVGTAALLNVGESLCNLRQQLQHEGYDLGDMSKFNSESLISALRYLSSDVIVRLAPDVIREELQSKYLQQGDFEVIVEEVNYKDLKSWLGKESTAKMERQWGDLERYSGISTTRSTGRFTESQTVFKIFGLKFGNFFLGIQPILGIEGDPMRLLFERDLTPHPQYAAFYQYLNRVYDPHVMMHFGMHGTVEWLPGSSLGNTAESWPDILLGHIPNIYVYACNNPSESILAKRRGYATIVSHNVPPYSRSGLYKELISLRELITEYRESMNTKNKDPAIEDSANRQQTNEEANDDSNTILLIANVVNRLGLWQDCPFESRLNVNKEDTITFIENALSPSKSSELKEFRKDFDGYVITLNQYLSELENRLFSEGLHILGKNYTSIEIESYLDAYYNPIKLFNSSDDLKSLGILSTIASQSTETDLTVLQSIYDIMERQRSKNQTTEIAIHPHESKSIESSYVSKSLKNLEIGSLLEYAWLRLSMQFGDSNARQELEDILYAFLYDPHNNQSKDELESIIKTTKQLLSLSKALNQNPKEELHSLTKALRGEYVLPAPGGDIIRDGQQILPTGRNIHALDPYRIPSPTALERGRKAAELIIESHQKSSKDGRYPETVSVNLWGLDTIKTKGESIGIVLGLVGAEPVREATGRIVAFELIPLEELKRPRIDVLGSLSGIFRDALSNICDLLDDLFYAAATADEPIEMNYIKMHSQSMSLQGIDRSYSRLFSNPPGDFGSMVNEQIGSGDWTDSNELGNTWINRNSFSYGKSSEKGTRRDGVLKSLLNTTDRIVQQVDSVEYGLTDIQEYFANTGALKKAAENVQGAGSRVNVSIIEAFDKTIRPRELESVLRMEYRTKLLNPKWSAAMLKQGSGGAYEISGRMTSMIGWAATSGFQEDWVFDGVAERYVLDEEVAKQLKQQNPEAFRNIVKRMMEANGRGFWKPSDATLSQISAMYEDIDDIIEGV